MNHHLKSALLLGAFLALAACQKAETPPEVREDVAAAKIQAEADVAIAKAEGEHDIEVARCEALTGSERETCKDQADKVLDAAKTAARDSNDTTASQ